MTLRLSLTLRTIERYQPFDFDFSLGIIQVYYHSVKELATRGVPHPHPLATTESTVRWREKHDRGEDGNPLSVSLPSVSTDTDKQRPTAGC